MSGHTPGPWSLNTQYADIEVRGPAGSGVLITVMAPWGVAADTPTPQFDNARLIAAAPELLEALKVAEQFMSIASDWNIDEAEINGEMRSTYDWLEVVRAAIARATGVQA